MMASNRPSNWNALRKQVYQRDNHECQNCGRKGGQHGSVELHAHHGVPLEKGGVNKISNLKTYCKRCHKAIHSDEKKAPTAEGHDCPSSFKFQDGGLRIFEDFVEIQRVSHSEFSGKCIRTVDIQDVKCNFGVLSGYIQIREKGVEPGESGIITHPSDENTLHYPRTKRELARETREDILDNL